MRAIRKPGGAFWAAWNTASRHGGLRVVGDFTAENAESAEKGAEERRKRKGRPARTGLPYLPLSLLFSAFSAFSAVRSSRPGSGIGWLLAVLLLAGCGGRSETAGSGQSQQNQATQQMTSVALVKKL